MIKVKTRILKHKSFRVNALDFLPEGDYSSFAIFSHGYTSHKGTVLPWAHRLAESGVRAVVFDLPGHYLGSYNEVTDLDEFKNHVHELFLEAHNLDLECKNLILGGHSMGGLLAIKAVKEEQLKDYNRWVIGVGLGDGIKEKSHLFYTDFFKSALNLRTQLVSPSIAPDHIFPWVVEEKMNLRVSGEKIHLIVGKDDLVTPPHGVKSLIERLEGLGANVSLNHVPRLPHHYPEKAAGFIKNYLKKEGLL